MYKYDVPCHSKLYVMTFEFWYTTVAFIYKITGIYIICPCASLNRSSLSKCASGAVYCKLTYFRVRFIFATFASRKITRIC